MLGIVGLGFMGMTHFTGAKAAGVKVSAFATRSEAKRSGNWSSIQGNFGPRGGANTDLMGATAYADWRELIADPAVELVDICLPTPQHREVAVAALEAGKAVLVEKPIELTVTAAEEMRAAAEKAGRPLMVAHVLPYFIEWEYVLKVVESGQYGRLLSAHLKRHISPPEWLSSADAKASVGGWGLDLHIHDNHFVTLLGGTPAAVRSDGLLDGDLVDMVQTKYEYPGDGGPRPPVITCSSTGVAPGPLKFLSGYELFFERACLQFEAGTYGDDWVVSRPVTLVTKEGIQPVDLPTPEWYSPFEAELRAAAAALESGQIPAALSCNSAIDALKMCHAEAESIRTGQAISIH